MTNKIILSLKDNQINDKSQNVKITNKEVIEVLRYLSSHPLKSIKDDEHNNILMIPHSFLETKDDIGEAYVLTYSENIKGDPEGISTNNVVGFIGCKDVEISIHSRFSPKNVENDYFLYYMLEKVMTINVFNFKTSSSIEDSIFDFLLFFFPKMLKEALSQGMYKKYVYHEYNDANVRGVIDINRHIRRNFPANGRIAYRTREFSYDNPITQLIRHTIEFIRRKPFGKAILHNDADTEACVQQIILATPTFVPQQRQAVINDNLRPVVHPYYTKYFALQKLCLRILRHEKLCYGKDHDNKINGILIDAAWLWEEYLACVLTENGSNLKHYTLDNSPFHLFKPEMGKSFQLIIPDYYDDEKKIVADAKYIPLHRNNQYNADRAAAIYYKTIMYMYRFETKKGFLFHPCSRKDLDDLIIGQIEVENNIVSCDYEIEDRKDCHLYEVGMVINDNITGKNANGNITKEDANTKFKNTMKTTEKAFVEKINDYL